MVLVATYPVFAYIFSVIIIGEKPSFPSATAVVTAFVGIYLVMTGNNDTVGFWSGFGVYEVLAVSVGVLGGLVIITIRKLHQTDTSYSIYFSQCAIGFCLAVVPSRFWSASIKSGELLILLSIGVLAAIGQLMMTQSYKHLPVRKGAVLGMLEPLFCYIAGVIIFGEFFSITTAFGSLLIVGSCAAVVLLDGRAKTDNAKPGKAQVCKS
jgi:drug/metabolite transporter (DMT)-like permease